MANTDHQKEFTQVQFSSELREAVADGRITLTFRLWRRAQVKVGGHYAVGSKEIEIEDIEVMPFGSIASDDLQKAGETSLEALRQRAAHSGPINDDTLVYRIEFHVI